MRKDLHLRRNWPNYLMLGIFLYIAYLPLSSFLFAPKNDALTANFPNKYFFSAALHAGKLPLWNPFINFGLPLYADPGFAFWHPLTWLFGAIGYNIYMLVIEVLCYTWLGGIFMYRLGKYLGHGQPTAFLMGILFMCCGFFIGNQSHINFLTAAAFLPLVLQTFLQLQQQLSPKRLLFAAGSLFLVISAGHPAIPFATVYFLSVLVLALLLQRSSTSRGSQFIAILKTNGLLLLTVLGLAAPVLLSWVEIYTQFSRSKPVLQSTQTDLGFTFSSFISFLFPFSTTAYTDSFSTDLSMRNGYFSFLGFALFIIAMTGRRNKCQNIFLASGAVMLLFSLGGPFKADLYRHLPLLRYVRSNGEYRIFAILSFIIVLSYPLDLLLKGSPARLTEAPIDSLLKERTPLRMLNHILAAITAGCSLIIAVVAIYLWRHGQGFPFTPKAGLTANIKNLLDYLSFPARLLINATYLLLLLSVWFLLKNRLPPAQLLPPVLMADLVLFCWLHLPVTGVQQKSPSEITKYFSTIAPRLPIPRLIPICENIRQGEDLQKIIGCWSYYSKQPGAPQLCEYPTLLSTTEDYFNSNLSDTINTHPFIFLQRQLPGSTLSIKTFGPQQIDINVFSPTADTLILLQNSYPGWKTQLNDKPHPWEKKYISFMGSAVPAGSSLLSFRFENHRPGQYFLISLVTLTILIALSAKGKKQNSLTRDF